MNFISIPAAGITLKLASFRRLQDRVRGEVAVNFNNGLLDGTDQRRREWEGETIALDPAETDAIRAAVSPGPVVITGEKLRGASVTVLITITEGSEPDGADAFLEPLNLSFREV